MAASFEDLRREGRADALLRLIDSKAVPMVKGEADRWCELLDLTSDDVMAAAARRSGRGPATVSRYGRQANPRHGTISAYTNHHCRCDDCRRVMRQYNRERRARLRLVAS